MMELASRTSDFRIQGADLDFLCRLAGRPPPDDYWGGEYEDDPYYGNPIDPTLTVDHEIFHGVLGTTPCPWGTVPFASRPARWRPSYTSCGIPPPARATAILPRRPAQAPGVTTTCGPRTLRGHRPRPAPWTCRPGRPLRPFPPVTRR
jgi:hypothetical protein